MKVNVNVFRNMHEVNRDGNMSMTRERRQTNMYLSIMIDQYVCAVVPLGLIAAYLL